MRRTTSSHRGLSTIVTTGIMLSAVAILGSAVVSWSNGNLKVFETALSTTAVNNTNKITENMAIENIAFCSNCDSTNSKNVINVTLTNIGTVSVKITQIQVNSTTINFIIILKIYHILHLHVRHLREYLYVCLPPYHQNNRIQYQYSLILLQNGVVKNLI